MKTLAEIAAELPGYDPEALSIADASAFLLRLVEPITDTETLPLQAALSRVLAHDVISPIHVPAHDNSAMDGYAFAGTELTAQRATDQPLTLRMVGTALAGRPWAGRVAAGECVRIMTGAVMPAGLDTVVPQEFTTTADGGQHIGFATSGLRPGTNRRRQGEDLAQGSVALARGAQITPAALGLLASLGLATVTVYRRLRVAYFSTGDEILSLGEAPREGAVYDSNRYTVWGLLTRLGVEVIDLGVVRDEPAQIEAALQTASQQADAIITSGGVSAGDADHTRSMMKKLGDVVFWRLAMRPGRPMAAGRIAASKFEAKSASSALPSSASSYHKYSTLLGLPGNPVAVMVAFVALVRPALLRMMGSTRPAPPLLRAVATTALRKRPGRTEYQRGSVTTAPDGTLQVCSTGHQGSGLLHSMVQANGLIVLRHDQGDVAAGDMVDVMMFDGVI